MLKHVFLLVRKEGWTTEEFSEYFLETHAPLVAERPHLKRYVTSLPEDADESKYDGIAELYYENRELLEESAESEAGQRAFEDAEKFIDMEAMDALIVDEHVQIGD